MKHKKAKSKKKLMLCLIIMILFLSIILFFIYYGIAKGIFTGKAISSGREFTVFRFYLNNSGRPIDGEVSFDDSFYGRTRNGNISVYSLLKNPSTIRFKGTFNKSKFDLIYSFPEDYKEYEIIPFILFEEDFTKDDFYYATNLHWAHMPLTYRFINYCSNENRIKQAFEEFSKFTNGSVYFIPALSVNADITIICYSSQSKDSSYVREVIGEAGLNSIKDNLILNSSIYFYPTISSCGYFPTVEIHEILHTLGYGHSPKISSLMYNSTDNCKWLNENKDIYGPPRIDDEIVLELKKTYARR